MSKDVAVTVRADTSKFAAGMLQVQKSAKDAASAVQAGFSRATGSVRQHEAEITRMQSRMRDLRRDLAKTDKNGAHALTGQARAATKQELADLREKVTLAREAKMLAQQAADQVSTGMLRTGTAIAAGLAASAKAAMSWESAFAGVRKTVDELDPAFAGLEDQLRGMARTMSTSHEGIAAVAEEAGALGVATKDIAGFTRTMVILGETTNVTASDAATSMAQFMTIMGTAPEKVGNLAASLVDLGNNGASTEAQILDLAQRLAGAGRAINLTEAEVMGFASAIASTGMNVEAGGSAMSRVFTRLDRIVTESGGKLESLNKLVGADFAKAFRTDASSAVIMLVESLGKLQSSGGSITSVLDKIGIKSIYETDVIRRLAGAHGLLAGQVTTSGEAMLDGTAHLDEYAKRAETAEFKTRVAWNNIKDAAIEAGTDLLPIVEDAAEGAAGLAQTFGDMSGPVRSATVHLAGAGAAALLVSGGSMKAIKAASGMSASLTRLGLTASAAKVAIGGVGLALAGGAVAYGLWADAAARAKQNTEDFASTLDVVDGKAVATAATYDSLNTKLVTTNTGMLGWGPSVADLMDDLGVSAQLAQQYILGTATSTERLMNQMGRGPGATDLLAGLTEIRESMSEAEKQALQKAAADQAAGADAAQHGDAMREEAGAARSVAEAMSDYTDELLADGRAQLGLRGDYRGFEAAIDAAAEAVKRNGKTLDEGTKEGRENADALDAIASKGLDVVDRMLEMHAPIEDVKAAMKTTREEFITAAEAMGMEKDEAKDLADQLELIPSDVYTRINTEIDPAGIDAWNEWQPPTKWGVIKTKVQGEYRTAAGTIAKADGGLLVSTGARRLMEAFADGGTALPPIRDQRPRIEHNRGKRGIQWSEEGAGPWEGFVSGHPGKRQRSRQVTEDIANRLGGDVTWRAADGGILSMPTYKGQTLDYWEDALLTPLELTRLKIRIRNLQRDLKATEKYGKGKRKKTRKKLRGLDRTEATQELAELRQQLADAQTAAKANKDKKGTLADRIDTYDAAEKAAQEQADLAARYADQVRGKATSGLSVGTGYARHTDAAGNAWYSKKTTSAGDLLVKARKEADDQGVLFGKIDALVKAGASRDLLDDLLKLDSVEEQIRVADAFLGNRATIAGTNQAYADVGTWSEKIGKLVAATPVATTSSTAASSAGTVAAVRAGTTINITTINPAAEAPSVTMNKGLASAAAIGQGV